ncbi:meiotic recombination protein REC114 [Spea bombifrons]|uniref:meiotic recombination protein REC114 n=1 Tax=Spea bombifrons TaxID=233779 RepID=UPI00234B2934|nr:meiotic recombination protein REC114 [Spea bombifrons]
MAESAACGSGMRRFIEDGGEWPLKRYGRLERAGESSESQSEWKVFDSNEGSGRLTLSILSTGHFFISQRHTLLEGFSLISAQTWLKVGKKADCLLFGSKIGEDSRMFRVQFSGESKQEAVESCDRCSQKLKTYLPVETGPLEETCCSAAKQKISVTALAQVCICTGSTLLKYCRSTYLESLQKPHSSNIGPAYPQPPLSPEELGVFLRTCLLDQHFPAFVEAVEKELYKLTESE